MRRILLHDKSWQLPARTPSARKQRLHAASPWVTGRPACSATRPTPRAPSSAAQATPSAAPASATSGDGLDRGRGATSLRELVLEEEVAFLRQQLHEREGAFGLENRWLLATIRDLRATLQDVDDAASASASFSPCGTRLNLSAAMNGSPADIAGPVPRLDQGAGGCECESPLVGTAGGACGCESPLSCTAGGGEQGPPIRWADLVTTLLGACALDLAALVQCVESMSSDGAAGAQGRDRACVPQPEIGPVPARSPCSGRVSTCPSADAHPGVARHPSGECSQEVSAGCGPDVPCRACDSAAAMGRSPRSNPSPSACYTEADTVASGAAVSPCETASHSQLASPQGGSRGRRAEPHRSRPMLRRLLGDGFQNETAQGDETFDRSLNNYRGGGSASAAREGCVSAPSPPSAGRQSVPIAADCASSSRVDRAVTRAVAGATPARARETWMRASPAEASQAPRAHAGCPDGLLALEREMDLLIGAMRDESRGVTERRGDGGKPNAGRGRAAHPGSVREMR